ncbi:glycosyl hydrolase family 28-related protein [Bradyrhizobium sp. UFLA05-112]
MRNVYVIGDTLTIPSSVGFGSSVTCSVQPTVTVAAVTTAAGSFTDSAGNKFQYVSNSVVNVRQVGAKLDYNGNLGAATDDAAAIQRAINFASHRGTLNIDAGGYNGNIVFIPSGAAAKVYGGLTVYGSVSLSGAGKGNTVLKQCDTDSAGQRFITLGDPNLHFACFYTNVREMLLYGALASANAGISMIYSNCQQQGIALLNVAVYTYLLACVVTDTGYGRASDFTMVGLFRSLNAGSTDPVLFWLIAQQSKLSVSSLSKASA